MRFMHGALVFMVTTLGAQTPGLTGDWLGELKPGAVTCAAFV